MKIKLTKKFFLLLIPILIIGFIVYKSKTAGTPVTVTTVKKGEVKQVISTSGEIKSTETANLSFPSGAKIAEFLVKEGDTVTKNQLLVKGNSITEYESYLQAQAALEQAISNLEAFKETYKANPDALSIYNEKTYWEKYNYYDEAIKSAQASLNQTSKFLSDKYIYAPFSGLVTKEYYKAGEQTLAASTVVVVSNPTSLYFYASVDEADFGNLQKDQRTEIQLDSFPNITFTGAVFELPKFATIDSSGNANFEVKVSLDETLKEKAVIGMHGDVEIITREKSNVVYADSETIFEEDDKKYVFKLQSGKAVKKEVVIGLTTDLDTEIVSGIAENDTIIYPKNGIVKDGIRVTIVKQ